MIHSLLIITLRQSFEDNSTLEGILGDLIIPSVKRKELALREKALASLGLCCLIAKVILLQITFPSNHVIYLFFHLYFRIWRLVHFSSF